jgi:hypothetical protein
MPDKTARPLDLSEIDAGVLAKVEAQDSSDECAVLRVLFFGLELVLRLLAARGVKSFLSVVRTDVEAVAGRDLSDFRLSGILGLVPSMIDVHWVGTGNDAKLEVVQKAKDGALRPPTTEEQHERKHAFAKILDAATDVGKIPRCALPARPPPRQAAPTQESSSDAVPSLPTPEAGRPVELAKGVSASQRREALLARVRARAAAGESVEAKEYAELRRLMVSCDNALTAHSVLQSLFARGEGKHSAASEAEVMKALCSSSLSMQSVRALTKDVAQDAVHLLTSKATGWFSVEAGVHIPDAKYFRRVPKGSAAVSLAALKAERQDLGNQLRALCELAKRREQGLHSPSIVADDVVPLGSEEDAPSRVKPLLVAPTPSSRSLPGPASVAEPKVKAAAVSASCSIHIGSEVDIKGLRSRADLNGLRALVVAEDKIAGRFELKVEGPNGEECVRCKPENLDLISRKRSHDELLGHKATPAVASTKLAHPQGQRLRKKSKVA